MKNEVNNSGVPKTVINWYVGSYEKLKESIDGR